MDPSSSAKRQTDSYSDDELEQPNCKRPKNDVFINYSYEDIGKQFISHLKGALSRNSFTISDHTMLPVGQDMRLHLLKAIEESEIYVVVFSTNYASSLRSLDELVDTMECLRKFDQRKVLPVFYKAEPSDVRSQEGSFKKAFQAHEANVDIDRKRVQKWKQALRDAGQLSGLTLQNGDEGKFVSKIVKQLEKMQSPQELHVADHPVVVGSRVKELISTLRLDREDVLVVAVFGISGIGKTTIVRATYNKISSYFDVSCFLEDIHYRGGGHNWKIELQNLLISCLTATDKFLIMHHHNDGVTKIKKLITGRKILLVLDDIDNYQQLKSLGINPASFYKGSRIIVITRDKQSLGIIPYTSYQTKELNRLESLNLFNQLMFSRDNNLVNMKFIEEVADLAGGLPLVLEVWSRYFIGHERRQWPSLLEKLKRIPHGDIQKQLQMSYDSLSVTAKNLFLDIACVFDGKNKELVVKVLHDEESAFFPDIEIQHLVDRFLVKDMGQYSQYVMMNQVIKEMGHEVVRKEHPEDPGQRTRLMGHRDVVRVFREYSGTDSVRSIQLGYKSLMEEEAKVTVELEAFRKMSGLRFIQLLNSDLQWSSSSNDDMSCYTFKHLKYLEWNNFPCKSLDNIDMGNVVVIRLWNSKLEKLWEGFKDLKKLKILDLSYSNLLTETADFCGLTNLEELNLSGCRNLIELHSSIDCLSKLVILILRRCTQLKRFPWEIIGKLLSLQKLTLSYCPNIGIERNHEVIDPLMFSSEDSCITELMLDGCNILKISSEIGSLKSLKYLDLSGNGFVSLPNSLDQLHKLKILELSYCDNICSIPDLPMNVQSFRACYCTSLVNLPLNMSDLIFFRELHLDGCSKLGSEDPECLMKITESTELFELRMKNCNVSQVPTEIGDLCSLQKLDLSGNTFSSFPDSFSNLSELSELKINDCARLQFLPLLPSNLDVIEGYQCCSLDMMTFDAKKMAYTFRTKVSEESSPFTKRLQIYLSGKDVPDWCSYQCNGPMLSFMAPVLDKKICGMILLCNHTNK